MIKDILLIVLSILSILFAVSYAITLKRLSLVSKTSSKLFVDNLALQKLIDIKIQESDPDQEVHKENFVKFLSDSRDWAFKYIEDVQAGLKKFVEDIEPEINYFKEYGDIVSMHPNYYSMKKITECYNELTKLLPETKDEEQA
jgi:hypothetical protein